MKEMRVIKIAATMYNPFTGAWLMLYRKLVDSSGVD